MTSLSNALSSGAPSPTARFFFRRIGEIDIASFRFYCLIAAMALYALLGSPTPDSPGLPEIAIGVLLILAARRSDPR